MSIPECCWLFSWCLQLCHFYRKHCNNNTGWKTRRAAWVIENITFAYSTRWIFSFNEIHSQLLFVEFHKWWLTSYLWGEHDDWVHQKRHGGVCKTTFGPQKKWLYRCSTAEGRFSSCRYAKINQVWKVWNVCYVADELILAAEQVHGCSTVKL